MREVAGFRRLLYMVFLSACLHLNGPALPPPPPLQPSYICPPSFASNTLAKLKAESRKIIHFRELFLKIGKNFMQYLTSYAVNCILQYIKEATNVLQYS
jgi:hypothetical protein